jgi:transcriptional regulator with XRE-family HTH domain
MVTGRRIIESEFAQLKEMTLGERAEWFRNELNNLNPREFTSTKVAERLEMSSQGLRNIERGIIKDPSVHTLNGLSKLYRVPIDAFLDDYYQKSPSLFSIGDWEDDQETPSITDTNIGQIRTQVFLYNEGQYKLILNKMTKKPNSEYVVLSFLSNLCSQIEIANCQGDDLHKIDINLDRDSAMLSALTALRNARSRPWKSKEQLNELWKDILGDDSIEA